MSSKQKIEVEGLEEFGKMRDVLFADVVTEQGQLLVNTLRQVMEEERVYASYNLVQSIELATTKDGFDVRMDDYWKYVNEGVKGTKEGSSRTGYAYTNKKPPISAIIQWESFKKTYKNVYALREVVFQRGIKPKLFIDKAIEKYYNL